MNKEILEMAFSRYEHSPKKLAEFVATYEEISNAKSSPAPIKEVTDTKKITGPSETPTLLDGPETARFLRVSERSVTTGPLSKILYNENPERFTNQNCKRKYSTTQLEEIREKRPQALEYARDLISEAARKMPFGYVPVETACQVADVSEHVLHDIINNCGGLIDVKYLAINSGKKRMAIKEEDLRDYLKIYR